MNIISVPKEFRPAMPVRYPSHQQGPMIEEYARRYFGQNPPKTRLKYLPIQWTGYHINHGYGKDMGRLREFVGNLPRNQPVWTVVQYDDGTLCDDILPEGSRVFGAGGVGTDPIPLLCDPHSGAVNLFGLEPKLAVFYGNLMTHPIRLELSHCLNGKDGCVVDGPCVDWISRCFAASFVLCPRGYGKTSFRMYEVLRLGLIPVYVYDDPWLPFTHCIDWESIAVLCPRTRISMLGEFLRPLLHKVYDMKENIKEVADKYFTMEGTCQTVKEMLEV